MHGLLGGPTRQPAALESPVSAAVIPTPWRASCCAGGSGYRPSPAIQGGVRSSTTTKRCARSTPLGDALHSGPGRCGSSLRGVERDENIPERIGSSAPCASEASAHLLPVPL